VLAVLHALTLLPLYDWLLPYYLHFVAILANVLTHGLGEGTAVAQATLRSPAYAVTVSPACSAVELACFIGAAVFAFPSPWRAKVSGFLLGLALIVVLNVVRVTTLFLVGVHARSSFDLVHEDVWAVLLIATTTLFVAGWIGRVLPRKAPATQLADDGAAG
jgi:exosortase/archaeosortase family protein